MDGTCLICDREADTTHNDVLASHWSQIFRCAHRNCANEAMDPDDERPLCHEHCDLAVDTTESVGGLGRERSAGTTPGTAGNGRG